MDYHISKEKRETAVPNEVMIIYRFSALASERTPSLPFKRHNVTKNGPQLVMRRYQPI
jgi:hypothetical protein